MCKLASGDSMLTEPMQSEEVPKVGLPALTKRQKQRRRENVYWDNVLKHELQKLPKIWARKRLQADRNFDDVIEEFASFPDLPMATQCEPPTKPKRKPSIIRNMFVNHVRTVPVGGKDAPHARNMNVCLVDALRSLGVRIPYVCDGPFWALRDGNRMLSGFGHLGSKGY